MQACWGPDAYITSCDIDCEMTRHLRLAWRVRLKHVPLWRVLDLDEDALGRSLRTSGPSGISASRQQVVFVAGLDDADLYATTAKFSTISLKYRTGEYSLFNIPSRGTDMSTWLGLRHRTATGTQKL